MTDGRPERSTARQRGSDSVRQVIWHGTLGSVLVALAGNVAGCSTGRVVSTEILTPSEFSQSLTAPEDRDEAVVSTPRALSGSPPTSAVVPAGTVGGQNASTDQPVQRLVIASDQPGARPELTGPVGASEGIRDAVARPGEPPALTPADAAGSEVLVEVKVGDVNGRPVFAGSFLEPMGDRLRAEARTRRLPEWRTWARSEIERELRTFIEDELLRAEALATLTPEQREGFLAFVRDMQRRFQAQNRGSREITAQRLYETEGRTFDEWSKSAQERELIRYELATKIERRVNISWRDIQQSYERNFEVFNPPPRYRFRMIQVPAQNADQVAEVTRRLGEGESFAALAGSELNRWNRDKGGLEERELRGAAAEAQFFANAQLNEAARGLSPGQTAGPFTLGGSSAWLHLEGIEQVSRTLYEAQLRIESVLRQTRTEAERRRYIQRLRGRATITEERQMVDSLLRVAEERYFKP